MAPRGGVILLWLLLFAVHSFAREIVRDPENTTVFLNQTAMFTCETRGGTTLWKINGTQRETFPPEIRSDLVVSEITTPEVTTQEILTIPARAQYNGTRVQCLSVLIKGSITEIAESDNATLTIQGIPAEVSNIAATPSVTISWTAPFSMDMTGVRYSPSVPGVQDASSVPTEGPTSEDGTRKLSVVLTLFLSLSFNIIMCIVIILLSICMVLKKRRGKPDLRKRSTSGSNLMGGKDEDGGMQDEEIKYQESKDKDSKVEESKYVVVKTSSVPRPSLPHDSKVQYSEIDIRATHKMARSQYAELGLPPTNQLKPSDMDTKTHTPYVTVLPNPSAVTDNSNSEKETADKAAPKVSDASSNLSGEVGVEETTPPGDGTNEDGNGGNENIVQVVKGASSPPKDEGPNVSGSH